MEIKDKLDVLKTILALKREGFEKQDINGYFEMLETSPAVQANVDNITTEAVKEAVEKPQPEVVEQPKVDNTNSNKSMEDILRAILN